MSVRASHAPAYDYAVTCCPNCRQPRRGIAAGQSVDRTTLYYVHIGVLLKPPDENLGTAHLFISAAKYDTANGDDSRDEMAQFVFVSFRTSFLHCGRLALARGLKTLLSNLGNISTFCRDLIFMCSSCIRDTKVISSLVEIRQFSIDWDG